MTAPTAIAFVLVSWAVLPCLAIDLEDGECSCGIADDGYKVAPWNALLVKTDSGERALGIGVLIDPSHVYVFDLNDDFDGNTEKTWHVLLNATGQDDDKAIEVGVAGMEHFPCSGNIFDEDHWVLTLDEEVQNVPAVCIKSSSQGKLFETDDLTLTYWKNSTELAEITPTAFVGDNTGLELPRPEGNEINTGVPATLLENGHSKLIGFVKLRSTDKGYFASMVRVHPSILKWIQEHEFNRPDLNYDCPAN